MLYGEQIREIDGAIADAALPTAIDLEAATGAILVKTMETPGYARELRFLVTETFDYDTQVAEGVLTLYRYPSGDDGSKEALGTIALQDAMTAGQIGFSKIANLPANINPPPAMPPANYFAGDKLAVWITTRASGGGYLAGTFQPVIIVSDRGENIPSQEQLVDLTP